MPKDRPEEIVPHGKPPGNHAMVPIPAAAREAKGDGLNPMCARCDCLLRAVKHDTGIAWRCLACGGESLNFSQFRRLIPELHANEIWMTAMERPMAPRRRARCPECRKDMAAVLIPFQGREIELDICRSCQRLWMENQENAQVKLDRYGDAPGLKPPVIKMTGRGAERMLGEQLKRVRDRAKITYDAVSGEANPWWPVVALVIYAVLRFWFR